MQLAHTASFAEERQRYDFRFTCESCAHFDEARQLCRHGYPNAVHRLGYYDASSAREIVFCKEFELG